MSKTKQFSILITTRNRKDDLTFTLEKIKHLIDRKEVECIICDDGSTDGTYDFLHEKYQGIQLIKNKRCIGLIASRNLLLNRTTAQYAISLDDDAHFLTENNLDKIENYFDKNPTCGVLALRIFWGLSLPENTISKQESQHVKGFVGCGHVWNMKAWKDIPNYPDWFEFYGEEDFAAFQLFKKDWEIHYLPDVLVHHRVDIKARKDNNDYSWRLRRSLRSGWYLYLLFYPWNVIPRKLAYTLWIQLKTKVFKGDWKAGIAIIQALFDVLWNIPKLLKNANRLTSEEFEKFQKLPETKLYWDPSGNEI
ncbi:MAG: glycosyltransferase family 2 protein [Flavobacteriaceae bacterium]|nr:glycosyltransferase family 2 protein [Flavobacteriaceae bacterium]